MCQHRRTLPACLMVLVALSCALLVLAPAQALAEGDGDDESRGPLATEVELSRDGLSQAAVVAGEQVPSVGDTHESAPSESSTPCDEDGVVGEQEEVAGQGQDPDEGPEQKAETDAMPEPVPDQEQAQVQQPESGGAKESEPALDQEVQLAPGQQAEAATGQGQEQPPAEGPAPATDQRQGTETPSKDANKADVVQVTLVASATKGSAATLDDQGATSLEDNDEDVAEQTPAPVADGLYEIASALSARLRLEVVGGKKQLASKTASGAASQRWRIARVGEGLYTLQSLSTGTYLAAPKTVKDKAMPVLTKAHGTARQQWLLVEDPGHPGSYLIKSRLSESLVLGVAGGSRKSGAKVCFGSANGSLAQGFGLAPVTREVQDGFYVLVSKGSGLALDVKDSSLADGANVQQAKRSRGLSQTFKFAYDESSGYYTLINAQSGKVLDIAGSKAANGANVQQATYSRSQAQQWGVRRLDDGTVSLYSALDGRVLSVKGGSKAKGANVQTWRQKGSAAQCWKLLAVRSWLPEGTYQLLVASDARKAVTVAKGLKRGAKATVATLDGSQPSEKWQLVWQDDGSARLVNLGSGYVLALANASGKRGTSVVQRPWKDADTQAWQIDLTTGGIVLTSKAKGTLVLDSKKAVHASGASMRGWRSNGSTSQRFHLVRARLYEAQAPYVLHVTSDRRMVAGMKAGSTASGATARLYRSDATTSQTFILIDAGKGLVRIRNAKSDKYLARAKGSKVVQTAGTSSNTLWKVSFDDALNALRISSAKGDVSLTAPTAQGRPLTTAKSARADMRQAFVAVADPTVQIDASSGKAIKGARVKVPGRGWLWADATGKLHGKVQIKVPYVNQYDHNAIMGCEGAALYMCLRHAGYCKNVSYTQFLDALVRSPNNNPNLGFVGSPWRVTGNIDGVLPAGAVRWANKYATGHNVSGLGEKGLLNTLYAGTPLAVWVTPHFRWSSSARVFGTTVPRSWHCMTLTGYDPATRKVQVADPASDKHVYWVSWGTFYSRWSMGQNAVTIS